MHSLTQIGKRLGWLIALPLAGCLATSPAVAEDRPADPGAEKKVEKKIIKKIKVLDVGCCDDEDQDVHVKVITEKDGKKNVFVHKIESGPRGFLGVHLVGLTPELRKHYTGDEKVGVLIGKVEKDSPAAKAGMKTGDVLVSVDGDKVGSGMQIGRLIGKKKKGDTVRLEISRAGKPKSLTATLDERQRPLKELGKHLQWVFEEDGPHFLFNPDELAEEIEIEVQEKLSDPRLKKKIMILKQRELDEKELEEKLQKVEKRLEELEKKLQGRADHLRKKNATT